MGLIGKLLEYVIGAKAATSKIQPGGGFNVTLLHFGPAGDDSQPLADDACLGVETERSGSYAAAGYLDANNKPKAAAGEKRIYARKDDGSVIAEIWLKNTGDITIINDEATVTVSAAGGFKVENDDGSFELEPGGVIKIQGIEVDPTNIINGVKEMLAEAVTVEKSLSVNMLEVHAHTHNVTAVGSPTGPMLSGTPVP